MMKQFNRNQTIKYKMSDNGGNNPPMPSSGGATGAVFTGTDATPIPLSAIAAAPAATLAEASPHAGVINTIDPYFYNQFVALTNFTWTTTQPPGTLLWSSQITPLKGHINLQYLAKLYNIWVGGLDYQVKVAGTGFHAGAIAVCRLPPNINPATLTGSNQFTMFEYTIIDPKTLEAMMKGICDQRPVMYHYMNTALTDPLAIGGYIAIYVLLQLNTSSSGSSQIDVQVFNKCAVDFNLLQIVPTSLDTVGPPPSESYRQLFQEKRLALSPYTMGPAVALIVEASTVLGSTATAKLRNVNTLGFFDGDTISTPIPGIVPSYSGYFKATGPNSAFLCDSVGTARPQKLNFGRVTGAPNVCAAYGVGGGVFLSFVLSGDAFGSISVTAYSVIGAIVPLVTNTVYPFSFQAVTTMDPSPSAIVWSPVAAGESIVTFQSSVPYAIGVPPGITNGIFVRRSLSTLHISQEIATGDYKNEVGQAALLVVVDMVFNTPLFYVKLYNTGAFSAAAVVAEVLLDFSDLGLEFVGYIRELDPIPGPTVAMATAMALHETRSLNARMRSSLAIKEN